MWSSLHLKEPFLHVYGSAKFPGTRPTSGVGSLKPQAADTSTFNNPIINQSINLKGSLRYTLMQQAARNGAEQLNVDRILWV